MSGALEIEYDAMRGRHKNYFWGSGAGLFKKNIQSVGLSGFSNIRHYFFCDSIYLCLAAFRVLEANSH